MSVTFGFYNSKEGDRRYDAIQMSSIFDGIIQDGILQHVGTAMVVKESEAMIINVGVGRAWFNHTWTLNDALLPLVVPQSEILLNRYDAVVLEVDSREAVRANDIKIIKGTPASNPTKPTMVKTNDRWQYPLAYIYVGAGVTSIRQANITNCVGTSECPFVTAPLDKVEIDDLIAQWQDQWKEFYEKQTTDMEETNKFWKEQWSTWFLVQTEEIQSAYLTWEAQWNLWYSEHTADMEATSTYWKEKWEAWFNEYTSINTAEMADWKQKSETEFREWFDQLQALLDGNTAASLAKKLLELQEQVVAHFATDPKVKVFLFGGGKSEQEVFDGWVAKYPTVVSMIGKLNMRTELNLMSHLDVMLSMDSANMHLASLVNIPVISVWGATHPYAGFMGWKQLPVNTVQLDLSCRPCSVYGQKPCWRGDYACLREIKPEQVIAKIEGIIN